MFDNPRLSKYLFGIFGSLIILALWAPIQLGDYALAGAGLCIGSGVLTWAYVAHQQHKDEKSAEEFEGESGKYWKERLIGTALVLASGAFLPFSEIVQVM